jgi:pimeloyl-ACP methyl ester carboxylesterase
MNLTTLIFLLLAASVPAKSPNPEPLGIALENLAYPHPVRFFPVTVEGRDLRMAYMDVAPSGSANGHTLLLLHGKNFFGAYWAGTIEAISAAGYRVVVPDQLGFGKSAKADIHYSFELLVQTTRALLDDLGVMKATVVGHSMGGMLAVR